MLLKIFLRKTVFLFIFVWSISLNSQTNIKAMFYNLLNYSSDTQSQNRTPYLKTILDEVQPDIFMVCELINQSASEYLFNNAVLPFNNNFSKATYLDGQSGGNLQQMIYYNNDKLTLESSSIIPTGTRDINHYTFKINTINSDINPINIDVFITHLKASRGDTNRQKRLSSIQEFVRELDRLPSDSYVLFSGDFNFYTSNEEGYIALINPSNSIKIIDPINRPCPNFPNDGSDYFDSNNYDNTYFWNNFSFKDIHTQSTRTSAGVDGAGGGMDDRFDFIMMSENFTSSSDLFYVNESYTSIGNNGDCYNSYVSNPSCTGSFSQNLRNALFNFSDHLPVVMEIETPQNTLSIKEVKNPVSFSSKNIISNELQIKINSRIYFDNFTIYNQLGQKIKTISTTNQQIIYLDTSNFPKGIYYLKVNEFKPLKFIKI